MKKAKIIEIFEEGAYNHGDVQPDKAVRIDIYTDEDDGYGFNFCTGIRKINEVGMDSFISQLRRLLENGYTVSFAYIPKSEYDTNGAKSIFPDDA